MTKLVLLTLLSIITFSSCIDTEYSDCSSTNNLSLEFIYNGDGQSDIFSSQIHKVDLFIFDQTGRFVQSLSINQQQLNLFQGVNLDLPIGEYQLLCFGNAFTKTELPLLTKTNTLADANLLNAVPQNGTITTSDSLYYGFQKTEQIQRINVTKEAAQTQRIVFKSGHIKLKIHITGLTDSDGLTGNFPPLVELTSITPQYDYLMTPFGQKVVYKQRTTQTTIGSKQMEVCTFYTPRFQNENQIKINIQRGSNGEQLHQVDLTQFLIDNHIDVTLHQELTIPILIEFKGTSVSITLPNWNQTPVGPEI